MVNIDVGNGDLVVTLTDVKKTGFGIYSAVVWDGKLVSCCFLPGEVGADITGAHYFRVRKSVRGSCGPIVKEGARSLWMIVPHALCPPLL